MKRILLLLFSLITTAAIGQYPINQILSSDSTMVSVGRNATGGIRGGLVNMVFADTTAANLSRISYYTGAQIWTTTDSAIWVRFKGTPSFWVKMAGASGGTTGSFWNITGNYFGGGVPLNYGVGTNSYDYLPLKTNNITRLLIPPDGILRSSAPANKYLMMDTTTLEMYYGDEVTTPTWQQTLTAGSTLTGDNIIDGGLNYIDFADFNGFAISVRNNSGIEFNGYNGAKRSAISVAGDSIVLKLNNSGNFYIDSLQNVSTQSVLLGGTSSINNRKIGYLNIGTGLSLSSGTLNSVWTASGNDVYNNNSGNVGIGTTSPDSTLTVIGGLRINNGAAQNNYVWTSTGTDGRGTWKAAAGGGSGWSLTGNSGTTSSNFIGTTDAQPLMFRYNNLNAGSIGKSSGGTYLGIRAGENDNAEDEPNVGVGYYALYYNTTGSANSAVGASALYNNTTGYYNSAVGASALSSNTTGAYNSVVGIAALASNTTGYNNSAVGALAGNNAKQKPDAKYQTLLGSSTYGTRDSITVLGASFIKETIVRGKLIDSTLSAGSGTNAVRWNSSTGEFTYADTTAGGGGGGWSLTGNAGTNPASNFIGTTDDQPLSFRVNNTWAGRIYTDGSVFIGDSSGVNNSALNNAGFGRYSLYNNTTGSYNTGSGAYSLYGNTTGVDNTGSGAYSLYGNTTGLSNTGSGAYSLYSNIDGELNTGSGAYSLYGNTTGGDNTGSGAYSLYSNTTGWSNTGSGVYSLYNNTSGEGNTGSGAYSLYSNSSGESNTGSGVYSLRNNTTGSNNTGMGYAAGYNAKQKVDAKNQILIGANTYGTRDSIAVIGASFMKETILRGKLIDSTLSAGAGTKAVRWNSSTGEFTYADTTVGGGGGSPAGSNKQVQYNNSGAFGGATGVEIGNTNNRLLIQSQSTTELPLILKMAASQTANIMSFQNSSGTELSYVDKDGDAYFNGIKMGKYGGEKGFEITTTKDMYFVTGGDELSFEPGGGQTKMRITYYPTYSQRTLVYGGNTLYEKYGTNLSFYPSSGNSGFGAGGTENLLYITTTGNVGIGTTSPTTKLNVSGTFAANQGSDVASANNLAVVANSTEITGTTQVNLIANTGWVNGSQITLLLASGITIKNGQTTSGSNITILLDGAADFVTSAASSLTLLLCEVGGTQAWREISRRSY